MKSNHAPKTGYTDIGNGLTMSRGDSEKNVCMNFYRKGQEDEGKIAVYNPNKKSFTAYDYLTKEEKMATIQYVKEQLAQG